MFQSVSSARGGTRRLAAGRLRFLVRRRLLRRARHHLSRATAATTNTSIARFGRWCGFLFGWAQLTTVISGNIGIMAYAFADYAVRLWPRRRANAVWLAIAPIVVLSLLNAIGVVAGKATQNLFSVLKVVGLAGVVIAGVWAATLSMPPLPAPPPASDSQLRPRLVFVLYAFGGWSHAAYVAAEVRDERHNLPRALVFGIVGVTRDLSGRHRRLPPRPRSRRGPRHRYARRRSPRARRRSLGRPRDQSPRHALRARRDQRHDPHRHTHLRHTRRRLSRTRLARQLESLATAAPVAAIAAQAVVAILLVLAVGTQAGRDACDALLTVIGLCDRSRGHDYFGGFETLVAGSAPVFWAFFLLTGLSVFVLRRRNPHVARPFSIPLFPLPAPRFLRRQRLYVVCQSLLRPLALADWIFAARHGCRVLAGNRSVERVMRMEVNGPARRPRGPVELTRYWPKLTAPSRS